MNGTMNKQPLLSICIPTWNRVKLLSVSLESFLGHFSDLADSSELELIVSDNCSEDDTPDVVNSYIGKGLPISYYRHEINKGAAANFLHCMNIAKGKYILLLGDDDILKSGSIKFILDQLRGKDYGLVHIHVFDDMNMKTKVYNNAEAFLFKLFYWFIFMSGSIFRKDIVDEIEPQKYVNTHLLQVPYYITSAVSKKENLIISDNIMDGGLDSSNNGGYNFYEVFVQHYLNIWNEFVEKGKIHKYTYEFIKKNIYVNFIIFYNYKLLLRKTNVMSENKAYLKTRKGFKVANARAILKKYYGNEVYYKLSWKKYIKYYCYDIKMKIISYTNFLIKK